MQVVIYARHSWRPGQIEKDNADDSTERQLADMEAYCETRKWSIVGRYWDKALSGADANRQGMWDAINSLKRNQILLVRSYDRIARDVIEVAAIAIKAIRAKGADLYSMTEGAEIVNTHTGKFVMVVLLAVAEMMREISNARTRAAMLRHQRSGRLMSGRPPYGYAEGSPSIVTDKDGDEVIRRTLVPNEQEQAIITKIKGMHKAGVSQHKICKYLTEAGFLYRGKRWWQPNVHRVLKREGLLVAANT